MATYLPDTNVLIAFGRDVNVQKKLENVRLNGSVFVIAPPVLIELVRGMVRQAGKYFESDKQVFVWLHAHRFLILELPRPFLARNFGAAAKKLSSVVPAHYSQQIDMIANSTDFRDFLKKCETLDNVWRETSKADDVHEAELDRELGKKWKDLAQEAPNQEFAGRLSRSFGAPGAQPDPLLVREKISAALEFLDSSLSKAREGANQRKNDAGLYTDFNLLLYLADPEITFLSNEDFSNEIKVSPQKSRIIGLDSLP
jgi:hypothetical protein